MKYFKYKFKGIPYVDILEKMILSNKTPWVFLESYLAHPVISNKHLEPWIMETAEIREFWNLQQKQLTPIKSE